MQGTICLITGSTHGIAKSKRKPWPGWVPRLNSQLPGAIIYAAEMMLDIRLDVL